MSIVIERPDPKDADVLTQFYRQCRKQTDTAWFADYFQSLPDDIFTGIWHDVFNDTRHRAMTARIDGAWAGFSHVGPMSDGYADYLADAHIPPNCGELHQIYIAHAYQKRGLGEILYQQALRDLAELGHQAFVLCTYHENKNAIAFYEAMGAKILKHDVLHVTYSGKDWQRPVIFMTGEI